MASSSSKSLAMQYPTRSISLPSRLHPNATTRIETHLNKLKTWELSSSHSLSGEAIQTGLIGLAELYDCVQELMQSPTTQQALLQHEHGIIVEEALEESVELLDSCGYIRELLSTINDHVQKLQSALRRKNGDSSLESDINSFISFRKKAKKDISKGLKKLKNMENRAGYSSHSPLLDNTDHYLSMVIRVFREVTAVTISVLRSIFLFFSCPVTKSKLGNGGWSLISKLMLNKSTAAERSHDIISDMGSVDIALSSLQAHFRNNGDAKVAVQMAQERLNTLNTIINNLDNGLECLFKKLVQNRVSLLNILTC